MIPGLINVTDHTVTYTGSYGYQAKDLVIPGTVVDADGTEYRVIAIDNIFQSSAAVTGNLTIGNNVERIGNYCFMNCNNLTGSLTLGRNITSIGS